MVILVKQGRRRYDPGIAYIFGGPIIEDGQVVKNQKLVLSEALKMGKDGNTVLAPLGATQGLPISPVSCLCSLNWSPTSHRPRGPR